MTILPPNAIPGVDTFILEPPGLGAALRISIAMPPASQVGASSEEALAVAYITDADFCFGTAAEHARMMYGVGEIAPVVVVGIGYAAEAGDLLFSSLRRGTDFYGGPRRTIIIPPARELTLGGADGFLAALRTHVFPAVEARVPRIDPARRFIFGISAGGHFTAYALVNAPRDFAGYAMMSPNLRDFPPVPGADILVEAVERLEKGSIPPGVRVFLSAGENEEDPDNPLRLAGIITNLYRMQAALAAHGAATSRVIFPGETHTSVFGAAMSRAFRFLFGVAEPPRWVPSIEHAEEKKGPNEMG